LSVQIGGVAIVSRVYLSPPNIGQTEISAVVAALGSGWAAPVGPELDLFESDIARAVGRTHAVALSSGTAALHLGLKSLGVGQGDEVVVPTLTFAATAFAVSHAGAQPVFVDSEEESWGLDPSLLSGLLTERARRGKLPAAVVPVDLFGRTCSCEEIADICSEYEIPVLWDSAEALGAAYGEVPAGSFGDAAAFSFNGNKIITTSGGGALVTDDPEVAQRVRHWSTQSREPFPWYEHNEIGYNYRMSNVLAALGRAQLAQLPDIIDRRRSIRDYYAAAFRGAEGVTVVGDPSWGRGNGWLTTVLFDSELHPLAAERVRKALDSVDIEARPVWKPMHTQPVFAQAEAVLSGVADQVFREGLCLPSGTGIAEADLDRVVATVAVELS